MILAKTSLALKKFEALNFLIPGAKMILDQKKKKKGLEIFFHTFHEMLEDNLHMYVPGGMIEKCNY